MTSLKVVKVRTPAEEDIDEDGQQYELQRQNCSDFLLVWASPIATAFANFGVQYNYDSIGAANTWLHKEHGSFTKYDTLASNMIFVGTLIGMIGFGIAGDLVGRNLGLMLCMAIQVLFGLLQGLVTWGDSTAVWILLIFMRMMIGVGAGGVYPLSAAKATEDCTNVDPAVKAKGASWAFFWRNPGAMMVWFNVLIMYASIGSGINDAPKSVNEGWDWSWRYILVFGAVAPAFCALFMHMQPAKVVETSKTRISQWNERRISRASRASAVSPPSLSSARSGATASTGTASTGLWLDIKDDPGVWWKFLGTAGGWFFFDWAFYGNHLMQPRILGLIMPSTDTPVKAFQNIGVDSVGILFTLGIIPLLTFSGVRWMQVWGFTLTMIMSLVLALAWKVLKENEQGAILLTLYCLLYGSYWITNVTTYVMSALVYKPSIRSTLNGASAAAGKVGAILGTTIFTSMLDACGEEGANNPDYASCSDKAIMNVMLICTGMAAAGLVCSVVGVGVEKSKGIATPKTEEAYGTFGAR